MDGQAEQVSVKPSGLVRWRSRRGQRELDLLLERYLDTRYVLASAGEREAYALLLEQPDPDILNWVLGRAIPPAELNDVINAITSRD
ncbi:MAG: succinate dehydrogenase assembly factor 2 [Gammaproteobacteria bacterium]|nr:succinate dehydrogenase assembly factor 2 [Gammaproteobacteria bacterium]